MGTQSDALMWLMSEAKGVERSLEAWARRLLMLNFVSVHTTYNLSGKSFLWPQFYLLIIHRCRHSHKHFTAC